MAPMDTNNPTEFGWANEQPNDVIRAAQTEYKVEDEHLFTYEPVQPVPGDASGISYFFSR